METVFITGANKGIGLALTKLFLSMEWPVIATYRDVNMSDSLFELSDNPNLLLIQLELKNENSVSSLISQLNGVEIDVIINNVGVFPRGTFTDALDNDSWITTFTVNTISPFHLINQLVRNLKSSKKPRIVAISSLIGSFSNTGSSNYAYCRATA